MESKIREYEENIEFLEKKVSDLEMRNASLRECLQSNVQFSTKLSNIIYEMDCLLVKKGQEILDLEKSLEESLIRTSKSQPISALDDFDIDMNSEELGNNESTAPNAVTLNVNDYVEKFDYKKMKPEKDLNGVFSCLECDYKTLRSHNFETHYRRHTGERPFGCKLCGRRFTQKAALMQHIRAHDDRLKLECSICSETFTQSKMIIKHAKEVHNGKGYERKRREKFKRKHDEI